MYRLWQAINTFFACLKTVRVRGVGRHSRSGPSRLAAPDCSESTESGDVFVDCQDRRLTSIPTSQAWSKQPKHLLLARNRIKVLRDGAFFGYGSLTSLDLQQNQIALVEEGAFQGLTRLKTLLLQHNHLGTLSEEALIPMPNLGYLRLYDNPWNCLCPMDSLIRTLQVPSNRNLGNHARWVILQRVWHIVIYCSDVQVVTDSQNNSLHISHLISPWLNGVSSSRCAEPIRLKGIKLKQVDPETLCKESDPTGDPQGDQTESTYPVPPSPIRTKPDATTSCHTYLFPQIRMDCSKRGKLTISFYFPELVRLIVPYSEPQSVFRGSAHISYATERLEKSTSSFMLMIKYYCCMTGITKLPFSKGFSGPVTQLAKRHIWFGRCFLFNVTLLASCDWFYVIVICHLINNLESVS